MPLLPADSLHAVSSPLTVSFTRAFNPVQLGLSLHANSITRAFRYSRFKRSRPDARGRYMCNTSKTYLIITNKVMYAHAHL